MGSECFSSTFQGKFHFQDFYKTVLYIQVLFKPVQTLMIVHMSFLKKRAMIALDNGPGLVISFAKQKLGLSRFT